ncbi:MAG TPA: type II toxin-antitoxin system RelB/DinJ family antitoxin [Candidatus Paceibacterota bacterium]
MATTTKTSYVTARVEPKLKKSAGKVFRAVGISTSDAMTLFLKRVVMDQGMPFPIRIPNAESRRALRELKRGRGKVYQTTDKMFEDILGKHWNAKHST